MKLHVVINGEQQGPFTFEEVAEKFRSGQLQATDLAWENGMSEWRPVSEICPQLLGVPQGAIPPVQQQEQFQPVPHQTAPFQQAPVSTGSNNGPIIAIVIVAAVLLVTVAGVIVTLVVVNMGSAIDKTQITKVTKALDAYYTALKQKSKPIPSSNKLSEN